MLIFLLPLILFQAVVAAKTAQSGAIRRYSIEDYKRNPTKILARPDEQVSRSPSPNFVATSETYWLSEAGYDSDTCESTVIIVVGTAAGRCLNYGTFSVKYTCSSATSCQVHQYSSTDCTGSEDTDFPQEMELGACTAGDADDDGLVVGDSTTYAVSKITAVQGFPIKPLPGDSAIYGIYDDVACEESSIFAYWKFYQNLCYNYYDGTEYFSEKYTASNYTVYSGDAGCGVADLYGWEAPNECTVRPSGLTAYQITTYSEDDEETDYTNLIIGLVVGVGGGLLLIGGLVYYFLYYGKAGAHSPQAVSQSEMVRKD